MITASRTTASLSDAKNSKIGLRCQAGCWDEFEIAMPRSTHSARRMLASRWNALSSTRWQTNAQPLPDEQYLAPSAINLPSPLERPIHQTHLDRYCATF